MTISETHTALVDRIKWRDDKTVENFVLTTSNLALATDRSFQSEHSAITLMNIRECQPLTNITTADFNEYLKNLRSDCVQQVLNDVFEKDYVDDSLFDKYPASFDNAVLLRMAINVSELIMTTSRSNRTKRFSDDFVAKLNYDVFRETVTKFANRVHYKYSMGISSRYAFEVESVQRRFGDTRNMLKTITKGQVCDESLS